MSELKKRPLRDSSPNEKTRLIKDNTQTKYMSETNRKSPVLDSNPNEITVDSNPNEITRQLDNHDIENNNGQTNMQTYKVCISSVFKNKWPPLKDFLKIYPYYQETAFVF